jgi:hypothetical protein
MPRFPWAPARAIAIALALAVLAALTGCAGAGGDNARERPVSQNYMRLPIR